MTNLEAAEWLEVVIDAHEIITGRTLEAFEKAIEALKEIENYKKADTEGRLVVVPCMCKDCTQWTDRNDITCESVKICGLAGYYTGESGYCLYGHRKE